MIKTALLDENFEIDKTRFKNKNLTLSISFKFAFVKYGQISVKAYDKIGENLTSNSFKAVSKDKRCKLRKDEKALVHFTL